MAYGEIKSVVRLDDSDAVTVTKTSSPKQVVLNISNIGSVGYPATKSEGVTTLPDSRLVESGSGNSTSTGSSSTVVAKSEGITQASETLLSCANDLSNVLSKLSEVSTSISSNMSGFSQVEQIIKTLNNVITNKDDMVSKIKEFANYLTTVVIPGYNSFIKSLEEMDLDTSNLSSIDNLFGGNSLGNNTFNAKGVNGSSNGTDSVSGSEYSYGGYGGDNMGIGGQKYNLNKKVGSSGGNKEVTGTNGDSGDVKVNDPRYLLDDMGVGHGLKPKSETSSSTESSTGFSTSSSSGAGGTMYYYNYNLGGSGGGSKKLVLGDDGGL